MEPHDFVQEVGEQVQKGFGFIPFIGSGMSAASGIPTGKQIGDYLNGVIELALFRRPRNVVWRPGIDAWPSPGTVPAGNVSALAPQVADGVSGADRHSDAAVRLEALGAKANWRTALQLLSRLEFEKKQPVLRAPDDRVVDSFFGHITRGRLPNEAHFMLAHLADALRIQTVLTTNFDDLIEQAFEQMGMPLAAFEVHLKAGLPAARLVTRSQSIVKLHGGKFGLRADFSLDEEPSGRDFEAFSDYALKHKEKPTAHRHILALGASASDRRTQALLLRILEDMQDMSLYWVCFKEEEVRDLEGWLSGCARPLSSFLRATVCPDLSALLLHLYQWLYYCLPPSGAGYPAVWPAPPEPYAKVKRTVFERQKSRLKVLIREQFGNPKTITHSPNCVLRLGGGRGLSSVAAAVCDDLSRIYHCIWLDMDDFRGVEDLFPTLADLVAQKTGGASSPPLFLAEEPRGLRTALRACLQGYMRNTTVPLVVFLNSRDGPGANAGCIPRSAQSQERQARTKLHVWTQKARLSFWAILERLCLPDVCFVVLCGNHGLTAGKSGAKRFRARSLQFDSNRIVNSVMRWLKTVRDPDLTRFVYSMTLFRHSRHLAALSSWALIFAPKQQRTDGGDNDRERALKGREWLSELSKKNVIRTKPGGLAWMHNEVREKLRRRLERTDRSLVGARAECHQGIADWYMKLYRSSGDPLAAMESLYHRFSCAHFAKRLSPVCQDRCGVPEYVEDAALVEAKHTLDLARPRILSRGHFGVFSPLLCDTAKWVKARFPSSEGCSLWMACLELVRDFAKAVGKFQDVHKCRDLLRKCQTSSARGQNHRPDGENRATGSPSATEPGNPSSTEVTLATDDCQRAVLMMGARSYEEAEDSLSKALERLGFQESLPTARRATQSSLLAALRGARIPTMRAIGRQWLEIAKTKHDLDARIQVAVEVLRRSMFLLILRAQLKQMWGAGRAKRREDWKQDLRDAEGFYALATDLMRSCTHLDKLLLENVKIRTDYAVMLSMVGRYWEAHRRLNEAYGYLVQSRAGRQSIAWAVIDLRRASTYLREASVCGARARAVALQDSAHQALTRARRGLAGHRRDPWWFAFLCELEASACTSAARLRLCRLQDPDNQALMRCRLCPGNGGNWATSLGDAMEVVRADVLRQARLVSLAKTFVRAVRPRDRRTQQHIGRVLRGALGHLRRVAAIRSREGFPLSKPILDYVSKCMSSA
jgi:hypothetical protein